MRHETLANQNAEMIHFTTCEKNRPTMQNARMINFTYVEYRLP